MLPYPLQHAVQILIHIRIPKSQHGITSLLQRTRARRIRLQLLCMLAAIQLDDQLRLKATKIGDVSADRHLKPKLRILKPSAAQVKPKPILNLSPLPPKPPRNGSQTLPSHAATLIDPFSYREEK